MLKLIYCFIVIALFICSNEAARILAVFPAPSISHQVVFRPLTQELVKRGHEVVVITTDPAFPKGDGPLNLTEINVHDVSYDIVREAIKKVSEGQRDFASQMTLMLDVLTDCVDKYIENKEIQDLIKTKQFDLLLIEAIARPALLFSHIYNVPVIQISSFGATFDNYDVIGAPTHPMLYPSILRRRINKLSILEKISEIYYHFLLDIMVKEHESIENAVLRRYFGTNAPTVKDLSDKVDMLMINMHPLFEGIRPVPPNVIYMSGMHQKPEKQLPADLKSYLDSSKNGVIYISFGTNCVPSLLPPERIQAIRKVFSDLPYNVLWKYDKDELPGKTDNIRIGKWFPQSDLLRHPNIKLFITQGGLQSTDEAITAGVPLIGIPILGDQWFNVERYEYHKIGIKLDIETLNYNDLKQAINTIIGDESYRRNIVHLRELMNDEPMKPLDRAIWWTEYVLRHGGAKHLRSPGANLTWAQYLELELVLILLSGVFVCFILMVAVAYFIFKRFLRTLTFFKNGFKSKKA